MSEAGVRSECMKPIDYDSVRAAKRPEPIPIGCLDCGYELGEPPLSRCPECGAEPTRRQRWIYRDRARARLSIPAMTWFAGFFIFAGLLALLAFWNPARSGWREFGLVFASIAGPPIISMGVAAASLLEMPRFHGRYVYWAWLTSAPLLLYWIPLLILGVLFIMPLLAIVDALSKWGIPAELVPLLALPIPFLMIGRWRHTMARRLDRLDVRPGQLSKAFLFAAAIVLGVVPPVFHLLALAWSLRSW